jgi:hypothetical protein
MSGNCHPVERHDDTVVASGSRLPYGRRVTGPAAGGESSIWVARLASALQERELLAAMSATVAAEPS